MSREASSLIRPRRIGVTGAVTKPHLAMARHYCAALGKALVERNAVIVTRGGKAERSESEKWPVDEMVVDAARDALEKSSRRPEDLIETVLSDTVSDREQFHAGTLTRVRGRTYEAERFGFVARLDGLIGIGGRGGTEQALLLALATERPILPVPSFGHAGADMWERHHKDVVKLLHLDEAAERRWQKKPRGAKEASQLAVEMLEALLGSMSRRCFVVMPFHERHAALYDFVIEPAVLGLGDEPIRTDRVGLPGDVGRQIEEGIQRADYVIVVMDGLRPNVLYELGLAHGRDKPTILLNKKDSVAPNEFPFDLALQQRLEYSEVDAGLPEKLQDAIRALGRDG